MLKASIRDPLAWLVRRQVGDAAAVPPQVIQGLALDPPQVLSVPGCNWRWSATAALAQAFRYFGHHAFPSRLDSSSKIKGKR